MGATGISDIGKVFLAVQSAGESANTGKEGGGIDFSKVMSQMTAFVGGNPAYGNPSAQLSQDAMPEPSSVSGSDYDRFSHRENRISRQAGEERPSADQVSEKLDAYEKQVKDVLKEELGVTDEQIEEAMKALGLSFADLLNPNQLAALVSELTGAADMGALLCDSGFLHVMQEIGELGKQLTEELGIPKEQLIAMAEAAETAETVPEQPVEDSTAEAVTETAEDVSGEAMPTVTVEDHRDDGARESLKTDDAARELQGNPDDGSEETAETTDRMIRTEESGRDAGRQEAGSQNAGAGTAANLQNPAGTESIQPAEGTNEFSYRMDTANIIRQIVEHVRVNLSNTATTLEMQLNPENLGKLYLQLTAKDGMVSARIMAQNEMVRAALESQVAELRENMEQSGIRVDAVEVAVGSHEFEKNLEQNARQQEREAEEQEKSAKRNRRINLNDLDELSGVMTEEESLVAQMMAEQGNSVDFSA